MFPDGVESQERRATAMTKEEHRHARTDAHRQSRNRNAQRPRAPPITSIADIGGIPIYPSFATAILTVPARESREPKMDTVPALSHLSMEGGLPR